MVAIGILLVTGGFTLVEFSIVILFITFKFYDFLKMK
jgi:hypothetical protein